MHALTCAAIVLLFYPRRLGIAALYRLQVRHAMGAEVAIDWDFRFLLFAAERMLCRRTIGILDDIADAEDSVEVLQHVGMSRRMCLHVTRALKYPCNPVHSYTCLCTYMSTCLSTCLSTSSQVPIHVWPLVAAAAHVRAS